MSKVNDIILSLSLGYVCDLRADVVVRRRKKKQIKHGLNRGKVELVGKYRRPRKSRVKHLYAFPDVFKTKMSPQEKKRIFFFNFNNIFVRGTCDTRIRCAF